MLGNEESEERREARLVNEKVKRKMRERNKARMEKKRTAREERKKKETFFLGREE